jgi:hypothetical protein
VILSACNTAAGDAEGARRCQGLHAHSSTPGLVPCSYRIALVVYSDATVRLITGAVARIAGDKGLGRAEVVRQSMLAMVDEGQPSESHPAYSVPFVVVGKRGAEMNGDLRFCCSKANPAPVHDRVVSTAESACKPVVD